MTDVSKIPPGTEGVGVISYSGEDGYVRIQVVKMNGDNPVTDEMPIVTVALPPETARRIAASLTWNSIQCEEGRGGVA